MGRETIKDRVGKRKREGRDRLGKGVAREK